MGIDKILDRGIKYMTGEGGYSVNCAVVDVCNLVAEVNRLRECVEVRDEASNCHGDELCAYCGRLVSSGEHFQGCPRLTHPLEAP